jgi:hypothetical protein
MLFVNPLPFPAAARLWMLVPLVACVAVVYRATRARSLARLPKDTIVTFLTIIAGMVAIALAFYLVHVGVRRI